MAAARLAARADIDADGTSPLDLEIELQVRAVTEEAEHITGRAFVMQGWRLVLDRFTDQIALPVPPLLTVTSIRYEDASGELRTLPAEFYVTDTNTTPGTVRPAAGNDWPATSGRDGCILIDYTCGYGADDSAVPASVKAFILARVQQHFAPVSNVSPSMFDGLLDRYKVYGC